MPWLAEFVRESNRIEGIMRAPRKVEVDATSNFIEAQTISIERVAALVAILQPGARLREHPGLDVRVGSHIAPPGGPNIVIALEQLLEKLPDVAQAWEFHREYETLHPFTDGNGRSGRALWLWQTIRSNRAGQATQLGFLHTFYYQTLERSRA